MASPADALAQLLTALDKLEIAYSIGVSLASSVHGVPRLTFDVDLVADLNPGQIDDLAEQLASDFYVDRLTITEALRFRFNVIHLASACKFDIFPLQNDPYSRTSFGRRRFADIKFFDANPIQCSVAAAEDVVLRKPEWYRAGGETSERQWNDLRGVLQVSGQSLDLEYLLGEPSSPLQ